MIKSLFGRKKKKAPGVTALAESVKDAVVGDVFTIVGFDVEYDDGYYLIEAKHRVRDQLQHMVRAGGGRRRPQAVGLLVERRRAAVHVGPPTTTSRCPSTRSTSRATTLPRSTRSTP